MSVNDGGSLPILKTLVDSLANTLTKLSVRQESIEKDISKIETSISNIPELKRLVDTIKVEQKEIINAIEKARVECDKSLKDIQVGIQPISKLSELIRKPLSVIVIILILITTAVGLYKSVSEATKLIYRPNHIINSTAITNQTVSP